jgi:hypothetical protein
MFMSYVLETKIQFLHEQRTEPYQEYGEGVAQGKIGYGAKNTGEVYGSAGKPVRVVRSSW